MGLRQFQGRFEAFQIKAVSEGFQEHPGILGIQELYKWISWMLRELHWNLEVSEAFQVISVAF